MIGSTVLHLDVQFGAADAPSAAATTTSQCMARKIKWSPVMAGAHNSAEWRRRCCAATSSSGRLWRTFALPASTSASTLATGGASVRAAIASDGRKLRTD